MQSKGQLENMEEGITKVVLAKIKSHTWYSAEDCLVISAKLENSPFSASAQEQLVQCLLARSEGMADKPKRGRPALQAGAEAKKKQSHMFFENYFTMQDWQGMQIISCMAKPDYRAAAGIVARAMIRCGWLQVEEADWKIPISFLAMSARMHCQGSAGTGVKDFMMKLHGSLKNALPAAMKESPLIEMYPLCPIDLLEPWLSFSQADGPLAQCPGDQVQRLQFIRSSIPTRGSHWTCKMEGILPRGQLQGLEGSYVQAPLAICWKPETTPQEWKRLAEPATSSMQPQVHAPGAGLDRGSSFPLIEELPSDDSPDGKAEEVKTRQAEPTVAETTRQAEPMGEVLQVESKPRPDNSTAPRTAQGSQLAVVGATRAGPPMLGNARTDSSATRPSLAAMVSASAALLGAKSWKPPVEADSESEEAESSARPRGKRARGSSSGAAARTSRKTKAKKKAAASAPARKAAASAPATKAMKKAATSAPAKEASKDPSKLRFPGTRKHDPVFYGQSTVYIDAGNQLWRIKPQSAGRVMTNRSFKTTDPKQVWKSVVSELKRLNP